MTSPPPLPSFICVGASAGGVKAMLGLAAALREDFPAPIFFVRHIGAHRSHLPDLLNSRGPNRAVEPRDGEVPVGGKIYVAPPDQHMILQDGLIRLNRGPKEHHARPAIDPLFRSAALECGPRAVGVVLTGMLDDGSAGLCAIKDCGGIAIVQDPADAFEPSMPRAAMAALQPDHVLPLSAMPDLLLHLAQQHMSTATTHEAPEGLRREHAVSLGEHRLENLKTIAEASTFSCPDCGGVLFELNDKHPVRYRCHTGHAFSLRTLAASQEMVTDAALWTGLRALQEKESILCRLAQAQGAHASTSASAQAFLHEADELSEMIAALHKLTMKAPSPADFNAQ